MEITPRSGGFPVPSGEGRKNPDRLLLRKEGVKRNASPYV